MFQRALFRSSGALVKSSRFQSTTPFLGADLQVLDMENPKPWHTAYPAPRNAGPDCLTSSQVLDLLHQRAEDEARGRKSNFVLVDLRRNDHQGGTIRGSINLPAQSLYPAIPQLYDLFRAASVQTVIWFCGSSKGRGTRAAGWFQDYIQDRQDHEMRSVILSGGIKGWVASGDDYVACMDGFDAAEWEQQQ